MREIEVLPPTIVDGVPLPRKVAYVEEMGGGGCGCLLAVIAMVAVALAVAFCGCRSYTVVPADLEVVPVRQSVSDEAVAERRTYVEAEADATGWYVPDAIMLELLGAE